MLGSGQGHDWGALLLIAPESRAMTRRPYQAPDPTSDPTRPDATRPLTQLDPLRQLSPPWALPASDHIPCWARSQRGYPPLLRAPSTSGPCSLQRPPCPATCAAPRTLAALPAMRTDCVRVRTICKQQEFPIYHVDTKSWQGLQLIWDQGCCFTTRALHNTCPRHPARVLTRLALRKVYFA